jgi:hypothetical protein
VHLLVRGDALERCKEDNKTKIEEMQKAGLVEILYKTQIKEIHADRVVLDRAASASSCRTTTSSCSWERCRRSIS